MNRLHFPLALTFALLLGACRGNDAATSKPASNEPAAETAAPVTAAAQVRDGVQTAEVSVGEAGFNPASITFRAGMPARLVVTRKTEETCATDVKSPDLGIAKTALPLNEPVALSFTPGAFGTFTFACGMDMVQGAIVVRQM